MDSNLGISIGFIMLVLSVVAIIIVLVVISLEKRKAINEIPLDDEKLNKLLESLGGAANLSELSNEHQRLKVSVKDINSISAVKLQELRLPAVIKGNELTLLVKRQPQQILTFLNIKRKEADLWNDHL